MAKKSLTKLPIQSTPETLCEIHRVSVLPKKEIDISEKKQSPPTSQLSLFST